MTPAVKRRAPSRRKPDISPKKSSKSIEPRAWANEALSVVCGAVSLFLLVSFLAHQLQFAAGYSLSLDTLEGRRNPMGPVGHLVGTLFGGFLGWTALVPITLLMWLSFYFWTYDEKKQSLEVNSYVVAALGFVGLLVFGAAVSAIFWGVDGGGSIGVTVARPMVSLFSTVGATLLSGALFLLSLGLCMRMSVACIVGLVFHRLAALGKMLFVRLPVILWRIVCLIGSSTLNGISKGLTFIFRPSGRSLFLGEDDTEKDLLPTPKLRRNALPSRKVSADYDDDEEEEEQQTKKKDYTHVVVQRRGEGDKAKAKELKAIRKVEDEEFPEYAPPELSLLTRGEPAVGKENDKELRETSRLIENKLADFGILGRVTYVHPGPVVTLFEFEPAPGVKVGRITALQDDLAMSLRAISIRIVAPIPKRGTVGIEVPNRNRDLVRLRDVLESEALLHAESTLSVPLGKDTYGDPVVTDIAVMPHLLMAGATGTGKSVCINSILISLLYRAKPSELGLILIDPKILELSVYEGVPHLRVPVVTNPRQAKAVLEWATNEMHRRYRMMQRFGVRNIDSYNRVVAGEAPPEERHKTRLEENIIVLKEDEVVENGTIEKESEDERMFTEELKPLPKILIVIDELADLMLSVGKDIEALITRLAQKARAAGIHLLIATQRPSVDVITGLIKANFPARLSFRVSSRIDSRTILDQMGADRLLGRGDMLLMLPGAEALRRVHGAFVSDSEVKRVIESLKRASPPRYDERIMAICERALEEEEEGRKPDELGEGDYDSLYDQAVQLVTDKGHASTSMLQRAFRIGYNRAARIIEMMEKEGVVGPMDGAKPREVLIPAGSEGE